MGDRNDPARGPEFRPLSGVLRRRGLVCPPKMAAARLSGRPSGTLRRSEGNHAGHLRDARLSFAELPLTVGEAAIATIGAFNSRPPVDP